MNCFMINVIWSHQVSQIKAQRLLPQASASDRYRTVMSAMSVGHRTKMSLALDSILNDVACRLVYATVGLYSVTPNINVTVGYGSA
jgi:hypothetical protein